MQRQWIKAAFFILLGYLFFDKGFAYLGVAPVFVGEVVLLIGLLAAICPGSLRSVRSSPVLWCWAAWAAFSLFRTIPYLSIYGIDAVRDAALYWYGLYAILFAAALVRWNYMGAALRGYLKIAPYFMVWAAVGMFMQMVSPAYPAWPGTKTPIILMKGGDFGVHWGGVMVATLLGMQVLARKTKQAHITELLIYLCWFGVVAVTGSVNRGGLVSGLAAMSLLLLLPVKTRLLRFGSLAAFVLLIVALISPLLGGEANVGDTGRQLSLRQVVVNIESIFIDTGQANLKATEQWRKVWWGKIIAETVHGPYFWMGKGYGYNLAEDNWTDRAETVSLRSPHSAHMSVLGRTGVPGVVLWALMHIVFFLSIMRYFFISLRNGEYWRPRIYAWIASYWLAFLLNSSLDVFLEGPQGAIPFWCLVGFGVAMMERHKLDMKAKATGASREVNLFPEQEVVA